jgi:geranylgeranyl transferase type-1 subunit beta
MYLSRLDVAQTANIIMCYTALLSLAILRDDFTRCDRPALASFVGLCQQPDGR